MSKSQESMRREYIGKPGCSYCGPVCYGGAAHNARVEDSTKKTTPEPVALTLRERIERHVANGHGYRDVYHNAVQETTARIMSELELAAERKEQP